MHAYLDVMFSLLCCKLSVVIHALALHLEQHGLADQAAVGLSLLHCCLELSNDVVGFFAVPAPGNIILTVKLSPQQVCWTPSTQPVLKLMVLNPESGSSAIQSAGCLD